jgi:hypothetical protein
MNEFLTPLMQVSTAIGTPLMNRWVTVVRASGCAGERSTGHGAQPWDTAELQLINLQQHYPGCILHANIEQARINPPVPGWDGAFDTK